jgi:hypothetical protein
VRGRLLPRKQTASTGLEDLVAEPFRGQRGRRVAVRPRPVRRRRPAAGQAPADHEHLAVGRPGLPGKSASVPNVAGSSRSRPNSFIPAPAMCGASARAAWLPTNGAMNAASGSASIRLILPVPITLAAALMSGIAAVTAGMNCSTWTTGGSPGVALRELLGGCRRRSWRSW